MTALYGVRVADLEPGDRLTVSSPDGELKSTFVDQCPHPLYIGLQLVIWRRDDCTWSLDALDSRQELPGSIDRCGSLVERTKRLRKAFEP